MIFAILRHIPRAFIIAPDTSSRSLNTIRNFFLTFLPILIFSLAWMAPVVYRIDKMKNLRIFLMISLGSPHLARDLEVYSR